MKRTKYEIEYHCGWVGNILIPKDTPAIRATNLPKADGIWYWAEPWTGMSETAESWHRNYGFLLSKNEVT